MTAAARDLVRRLRALQDRRHQLTAAKDHVGASQALELAVSLLDHGDYTTTREALLHATNPASVPPVPVALGPQDAAAATVSVDEVMALAFAYLETGFAYQALRATEAQFQQAYRRLRAAVERLATAAFDVNVDRAHHEGRLS